MKKVIFIVFCTLFFACSEEEQASADIIPPEQMAQVLLDVHLLEASMNMGASPVIVASAPAEKQLSADVLKKYSITKEQYEQSMSYYSLHPAELSEIYQLVLNELSKLQAETANK